MSSLPPHRKSTSQIYESYPNPGCRAVGIPGIDNYAQCVSESASICPNSLYFGKMFLCRHSSCLAIVQRTENKSV
jgi:hypothetical protein